MPVAGGSNTLAPSMLNMVVGDTHTIQALSRCRAAGHGTGVDIERFHDSEFVERQSADSDGAGCWDT